MTAKVTTMQLSPIQIETYYIRSLSFSLRQPDEQLQFVIQPGFHLVPRLIEGDYNVGINANFTGKRHTTAALRWLYEGIIESVEEQSDKFPYNFHVSLVGYFTVSAEFANTRTEGELAETMRVGASNILYSVARESLATATARSPFPALILPSVSMIPPNIEQADALPDSKAEISKQSRAVNKRQQSQKKTIGTSKKSGKK